MTLEAGTGHLLVATPSLFDDNFHRAVILLCRYDPAQGALGLVLNRPTELEVGNVLPHPVAAGRNEPLWVGGPVDTRSLWVVHMRADLGEPGEELMDGVWFGAESSLIRRVLATNAPDPAGEVFRLYAGYAGWGEGQLEKELAADAWRVVPAGPGTLFSGMSERLWTEMMLRSELPCSRDPDVIRNSPMN